MKQSSRSYDAFGGIRAMDYGTIDASITATPLENSMRAFTGHEHIAEIDGLIHMNARVYDSEIGRFLSADTIIQDSEDSQYYNRYSYVRNNPLNLVDPSGHCGKKPDFFERFIVPLITIVTTYALGPIIGGYVGGYLSSTGSTAAAEKGAFWSGISAGVANYIGHSINWARYASGALTTGATVAKASLHGLSRAVINNAQGGSSKAGFFSGFVGGLVGGATHGMSSGVRIVSNAIVGGTASVIGGGKFANGAMSGAFIMMFNELGQESNQRVMKRYNIDKVETKEAGVFSPLGKVVSKVYKNLDISGPTKSRRTLFQVKWKRQPVFRIDYANNPSPTKLHFHFGDMKAHRPWNKPWEKY